MALLVAACGSSRATTTNPATPPPPATTTPDVWAALRQRPLNLPWQAPGTLCPTTPARQVSPDFGPAFGSGPVYTVFGTDEARLRYGYDGEFEGSDWGGNKVLWVSSPDYHGPALIRGYQVDGTNEVRFERGAEPPAELQFPLEGSGSSPDLEPGWRQLPSYNRVRAPGCYAYQVDGLDFSEVILFEASDELVWEDLRQRPLDLPTLTPGEPCPTTPARDVSNFSYVLGDGPIYPVGLRDGELTYGNVEESEWGASKVPWISSADYGGPALIRGRQLDGPKELRFMEGADPPAELQFPVEGSGSSPDLEPGWRQLPSETRVRAPGCYAYQVDGLDITEVIVFRAEPDALSP